MENKMNTNLIDDCGKYVIKLDANDIANKIMNIERRSNMSSNRISDLANYVGDLGASLSYEFTGDTFDGGGTVTIQLPFSRIDNFTDALIGKKIRNTAFAKKPQTIDICKVEVFNDRAVVVYYTDGTFTKCVCGKDDTFNLYTGIAFCLFKRTLGKENGHKMFNDLMRRAFKVIEDEKKGEEKCIEEQKRLKSKQVKALKQKEARKLKLHNEKVKIIAEALKLHDDNKEKLNVLKIGGKEK